MATEAKLFIWHNVADSLPTHSGNYLVARHYRSGEGMFISVAGFAKNGKRLFCLNRDVSKQENVWHRYDSEYGDVVLDGIEYWAEIPPIEDSTEYERMMTSSRGEL